jgi:GNAT superfamily N-acetyltransferase
MKPIVRIPAQASTRPASPNQVKTIQAHAGQRHAAPPGNNRFPARPASTINTKTPNYHVQAPVHVAGHNQQIRATIGGTPQVAGSIDISRTGPGNAFISNLRVDQQHRRRGVAAKLIDAAVSAARRQGLSSARLEARPSDNGISSQALVAMYRRQGFKTVGKSTRGNPLMERKL